MDLSTMHFARPHQGARWVAAVCILTASRAGASPATATQPTDRGRIAVLTDDLPVGGEGLAEGIASDPTHLTAVLRSAGFVVETVNGQQIADAKTLNRARFDLLVLPYGPSFPVGAADNLRRFCHDGGEFISIGGYAFDHLLTPSPDGWQPHKPTPPTGPKDARWRFDVPVDALRAHGRLTFSGWMRTDRVVGEQFAFMAVYQYDRAGKLLEFRDVCQITGTTPWRQYTHAFHVNRKADRVTFFAGAWMVAGRAWFDRIRLTDAAGKTVIDAPVSPDADVDALRPRKWYRPHKAACHIDPAMQREGRSTLGVRLDYALREERLNTRRGKPRDGLVVQPTQLGLFDPDYRLRRARSVRPAPDQCIFPSTWSIEPAASGRSIRGYAATGVLGSNAARWRPLINAHDAYGRLRGAAGAIVHHYAGAWAGSSWAFFGLTGHGVFAPGRPGADAALVRLADHLLRDVYLISTLGEKACYRRGEPMRIATAVYNGSRRPTDVVVRTALYVDGQTAAVCKRTDRLTVAPGARGEVAASWPPPSVDADFYRIRAELSMANEPDDPIDVEEGGVIVDDPRVVAAGPKLTYRDNYLHVDGEPLFMFGTDDWSYVFNTTRETPLQWRSDMSKRRDMGVTIYENLQIGLPASADVEARFYNQVRGLVQLTQQYRQVYFPCLLVGHDVAADAATLRRHADFAGEYARRFAHVPGLIYYLNGDLRCRVTEAVQPELNAFLRSRYATDEALREAWGDPTLRISQIPAEEHPETGAAWSDVHAYDLNLFRAHLIRRWHAALVEAIRRHDTVHPTTSEFYQLPSSGVDVPAGIGAVDLSNIGYFEEPDRDIRRLPGVLKYSDLRSRGKSFGPGEYGVKTHPAWADPTVWGYHKVRTHEQTVDLFLAVAHYALGLGASRIHNWCWKDGSHNIFPWGMVHACDEVPKDTAYVHRNQSLLFRHFRCVYEPPSVYVMTPDTHRLGGRKRTVIEGILQSIQLALGCHVDSLGMLNEHALTIPPSAKVIFLPIPFCLTDAAYKALCGFVRGGGTLFVSGDVSFDPLRRRTHADRLIELCGVRFVGQRYPDIDIAKAKGQDLRPVPVRRPTIPDARPCIDVESVDAKPLWRTADGRPVVFEHRIGGGRVIFSTDPIELRTDRANIQRHVPLYRCVLDASGLAPTPIHPSNAHIHVMRVPLHDSGRVTVFYNADEAAPERTIDTVVADVATSVTIRRRRPALLWHDGKGRLRAAEVQGELRIADRLRLNDTTEGIVLSLDGCDLDESRALALMPLRAGTVRIATNAAWQDAVVEVGEVSGGMWRGFERRSVERTQDVMSVGVDEGQVYSVLLLCNKTELPRWREVIQWAMVNPLDVR